MLIRQNGPKLTETSKQVFDCNSVRRHFGDFLIFYHFQGAAGRIFLRVNGTDHFQKSLIALVTKHYAHVLEFSAIQSRILYVLLLVFLAE